MRKSWVGLWKQIKLIFWKIWFVSKKNSINKGVMPRFLLSALSLSSQGSKSLFVQARCMSSQLKICALIVGKFYKNYVLHWNLVRDLIPKIIDHHLMARAEIVSWTLKADQTDTLKDLVCFRIMYAISVSRKNSNWISADKFSIFEFFVQI